MSLITIAIRSLLYYWRSNFTLALGVAAATAVLTGALIVGDSMRSSLRSLALDRLGQIDEIVVSDGFFNADLAQAIRGSDSFKQDYSQAVAVILFPNGSVELADTSSSAVRASGVNVFGIPNEFWALASDDAIDMPEIEGRQVIINQALADQLKLADDGAESTDSKFSLTLRVPKPSQLSSDSSLGKKDDLVESLVELKVSQVVANKNIARFGLHVSQLDSPNIFVPIELLSDALQADALKHRTGLQANAILLSGNGDTPPPPGTAEQLIKSADASLQDYGLAIKAVKQTAADSAATVFDYYGLSSDRLVISDELATAIGTAFPDAQPVFTYLANDISPVGGQQGIPFSMVASIDVGADFPLLDTNEQQIEPIQENQIVLNEWAATDLGAEVGDKIKVTYFLPESTHETAEEATVDFQLVAIAKLTQPDSPFDFRRRKVVPAEYTTTSPTLANDPDLTPEVPGLTDAESIENWDLPFQTADKIRAEDDQYWNQYRTTPKAFVSLATGQKLWGSRFGKITSFRIPKSAGDLTTVQQKLLQQIGVEESLFGFSVIPIKRNAVTASSGSTPFDVLFLALSMFVIAAALILVSLLFRLLLQQRASELGTLLAVGLSRAAVFKAVVVEMAAVVCAGALFGVLIGIAYAGLMIFGLTNWWVGAISEPVLRLHISPLILAIGSISGLLVSLLTIVYTIRSTRKTSVRQILAGELSSSSGTVAGAGGKRRLRGYWVYVLLALAIVLSVVASFLGGEPQAGAFMGAGFLVLAAGMLTVYQYLKRAPNESESRLSLGALAAMSGRRNPLRSTLTVGLVAVASFLIVAVSSFRLTPSEEGTAGFDLIADSELPIYEELDEAIEIPSQSYSIRYKGGEDASCNNLYQSTQPVVLGVGQSFIDSFNDGPGFRWSAIAGAAKNPWTLLNQPEQDGAIPVVIDKNTANYSLKIFQAGGIYHVDFDSGQSVDFHVVGFLENSLLQGSLIISESNFVALFSDVAGYRKFLIRGVGQGEAEVTQLSSELEQRFSDQGLDVRSATAVLADFQKVQNTYISTFQTLGGLGLLLGTFGLAVVQIRSVIERQQEFGLMRSVGFNLAQLARLVLLENLWLMFVALSVGLVAALVTTLPHFLIGGASIPWLDLGILFALIIVFGLAAAFFASRTIGRLPLIESLRR